jgi:hypothetical protein
MAFSKRDDLGLFQTGHLQSITDDLSLVNGKISKTGIISFFGRI